MALVALAVAAGYASATAGFTLMGVGDALLMVTAVITIQRIAPADVLARIFGIVEGTQMGMVAAGSYAVSVLTSSLSLGRALVVMAATIAGVVLIAALLLRRHGDEIPPVDDALVDRLLVDPVFAGLPAPVIERLARDATRETVPATGVILREGDHGDRYSLIVSGEVAFTIGGEPVRTLGAGDSFGEIALAARRTSDGHRDSRHRRGAIAVGRDEFLATVTGHPRAMRAATTVADARFGDAEAPAARSVRGRVLTEDVSPAITAGRDQSELMYCVSGSASAVRRNTAGTRSPGRRR